MFGVECGEFLRSHGGEFGVGLVFRHLDVLITLGLRLLPGGPTVEQTLELRMFAQGRAGAGGLVEQRRIGDGVVQFAETLDFAGNDGGEVHTGAADGIVTKQNGEDA